MIWLRWSDQVDQYYLVGQELHKTSSIDCGMGPNRLTRLRQYHRVQVDQVVP